MKGTDFQHTHYEFQNMKTERMKLESKYSKR